MLHIEIMLFLRGFFLSTIEKRDKIQCAALKET